MLNNYTASTRENSVSLFFRLNAGIYSESESVGEGIDKTSVLIL